MAVRVVRGAALAAVVWMATVAVARAELATGNAAPPVETIVVTATRWPEPLGAVPAALSVVERDAIQTARPTVDLDESLNRVPGVFAQSSANFAQDIRVQIRGFGTRAAFGIRELRVLVDGLPETLPDGQTQLDGVDLGAVDRIEVLRGAASSLYGNAAGGVIQLFTEDGPDTPWAETRALGGSEGLGKYQMKGGGRAGDVHAVVHGSFLHLDGFRDHSAARSGTVNAKLRWTPSDAADVTLLLNAVDAPRADDPGGLTRAQAKDDPRQARDANVALDAGEAVEQGRIGGTAVVRGAAGELGGHAYVLYRDFENRLPVADEGIVTFHRLSPGAGLRYALARDWLGFAQRLQLGVDLQYQDDERRRFENRDGERGALQVRQREQVTGVGPYLRHTVALRDDLALGGGVRYDRVDFDADVRVAANSGDSGARAFDAWSPAGEIRYTPREWLTTYASIATALQVPTTTELADPDGAGFNDALDPQTALTYELGARADRPEWVRAGLALFLIELDDALVPFEQNGRTFFRNAGRSRRLGLELDAEALLTRTLRWAGALTVLDAEYRDYVTDAGTFDGNDEPGIPPWQLYQELRYRHPSGWFVAFEALVVGAYSVDDAHTAETDAYARLGLRAAYARTVGAWTVAPFVAFDNLLDDHYDATVRLNAAGARYFEPAAGVSVSGGVTVTAALR